MIPAAGATSDTSAQSQAVWRSALVISTAVAALAGFLFGYDNIVVSGAIGYLAAYYHLSSIATGWAAACALLGCLAGSAVSGSLADRFGLKKALYGCAACFALSSLGVWAAASFGQYIGFRILGGIGIGAASIVAPMYIAEISPAAVRGRLVILYQLGIVLGILAAVSVNTLIQNAGTAAWNTQTGWRWMFAVAGAPAILFALAITFSHESPRWLMKVHRVAEAQTVLTLINSPQRAREEGEAIRKALSEEKGSWRELFSPAVRPALIVGFILAAFSQTSGITALLSFLPEIFKNAGQRANDAFFQSILVGIVNLLFTLLAIVLVDRAGRKTLLLAGTAMQTIGLAFAGAFYFKGRGGLVILPGVMLFVAGHAVGNGAVCWVVISEIFPNKIRGAAMSVAITAIWIFAYLASQFFPLMQDGFGASGTFLFFACMAALNFLYVWTAVPETKGYSLEEIGRIWSGSRGHKK
jgi:SP family arabinose:H+ symporter-like MFS transporter